MDEEKEFTIRDRRTGSSDAEAKPSKQSTGPSAQKNSEPADRNAQEGSAAAELDFSTFVISLATSAQVGLGAVPHPETNQAVQNFPAAKQMIDILAMLKEKTKGNLTDSESTLMDQVLFNLRIHYVRAVEGQKNPADDRTPPDR